MDAQRGRRIDIIINISCNITIKGKYKPNVLVFL